MWRVPTGKGHKVAGASSFHASAHLPAAHDRRMTACSAIEISYPRRPHKLVGRSLASLEECD
ncbi:hypothetical protein, partial [Pseudomonas aeruginosa]